MFIKYRLSSRSIFLGSSILCFVFLGSAYVLEYWKNLTPCLLCVLQRYVLWGMAILCLAAFLHNPKNFGFRLYALCLGLLSCLGVLLANRQLWLQHLPLEQRPPCTAGFSQLLNYHSLPEALKIAIALSGECGEVDLTILGLSLAAWSFGAFSLFVIWSLWIYGYERLAQRKKKIDNQRHH